MNIIIIIILQLVNQPIRDKTLKKNQLEQRETKRLILLLLSLTIYNTLDTHNNYQTRAKHKNQTCALFRVEKPITILINAHRRGGSLPAALTPLARPPEYLFPPLENMPPEEGANFLLDPKPPPPLPPIVF